MNNPIDFVPPRPVVKQPPSCWLVGGIGCLVIIILAALAIGIGTYKLASSKTGKELMKGFGGIMQNAEKVPEAKAKMVDIKGALARFVAKTGKYPKDLLELYPDYLADRAELHTSLDANPDPRHVSFTYSQPSPDASASFVVLSLKWDNYLTFAGKTLDDVEVLSETIGGQITVSQYQDGKLISQQVEPSSS